MIDDERFSQDAIDDLPRVEPSARLQRLVAQIPIEHPRTARSFWPFGSVWVPGLSLAAAALLGVHVGKGWSELRQTYAPLDSVATATSDETADVVTGEEKRSHANSPSGDGIWDEAAVSDAALDDLLLLASAAEFEPSAWDLSPPTSSDEMPKETY